MRGGKKGTGLQSGGTSRKKEGGGARRALGFPGRPSRGRTGLGHGRCSPGAELGTSRPWGDPWEPPQEALPLAQHPPAAWGLLSPQVGGRRRREQRRGERGGLWCRGEGRPQTSPPHPSRGHKPHPVHAPGAPSGAHPPPPYLCGARALPAHCCLQVESLRILLLAEQALREGLEEALARRSALDLALSCPGSVPFMQTALGSARPRLCPFCPASSSGTCPARGARRQPRSRLPPPRGASPLLGPAPPVAQSRARAGFRALEDRRRRSPETSPPSQAHERGLPLPRLSATQRLAVPSVQSVQEEPEAMSEARPAQAPKAGEPRAPSPSGCSPLPSVAFSLEGTSPSPVHPPAGLPGA